MRNASPVVRPAPSRRGEARNSFRTWRATIENLLCTYAFQILFIFIYFNINAILFVWGAREEYFYTQTPVLRDLIAIARGFGYALNFDTGLVIVLACRRILTYARSFRVVSAIVPFDKAFPDFHKVVGWTIIFCVTGHCIFHFAWIIKFDGWISGLWGTTMCVVTGVILSLCLAGMAALGISSVKDSNFRVAYVVHLLGATLFYPLLILHGQFRGKPYTWKWVIGPCMLYIVDRGSRVLRATRSETCGPECFKVYHDSILCISLRRQFDFMSGQYAELRVPAIDSSWHPFTIASAPHEESLRFYVRSAGKWTSTMRDVCKEIIAGNLAGVEIFCRGPYGAPAQHVNSYKNVILISGGVGATPFCSITLAATHFGKITQSSSNADTTQSSSAPECQEYPASFPTVFTDDIKDCEVAHENILRASTILGNLSRAASTRNEMLLLEEEPAVESMVALSWPTDAPNAVTESSASRGTDTGREGGSGQPLLACYKRRRRLLLWLHSVRFNFLLLWIAIGRVWIVLYSVAFRNVSISNGEHPLLLPVTVAAVDNAAGVFVSVSLVLAVSLELCQLGPEPYFSSRCRGQDLFCLVPLALLSNFIAAIGTGTPFDLGPSAAATRNLIHFVLVLPILLAFLCSRLYRVIGGRVLLGDPHRKDSFNEIESIDFVWTSPTSSGDEWLVREMLLAARAPSVRLHRFITRGKREDDLEGGTPHGITTVFGERPDFDEIFERAALGAAENSKIGVFFCGPPAMGRSVKCALMKAQARSNFRGICSNAVEDERIHHSPFPHQGSFIRFVFREENF